MDNSANRRIIKAKRKSKHISDACSSLNKSSANFRLHGIKSIYDSHTKLAKDSQVKGSVTESSRIAKKNFAPSPVCTVDDNVKRNKKSSEQNYSDDLNAPTKFSANDRLKKYRVCLNQRKSEVVKVHRALTTQPKEYQTDISSDHSLYLNKKSSILGKRPSETDKKQSVDYEAQNKKCKITKNTGNVKTIVDASSTEHNISRDLEMDWSPINETEIISNIQKFRDSQQSRLNMPEVSSFIQLNDTSRETTKNDALYIVIDTNIFISHLHLIQEILSEEHVEYDNIIYIPWIVVQELDYFKDGRSGSTVMLKAAKKAIKFINENLINKHKRLKGQTVQEALSQKESNSNADDNILFCCIHLAQTSKNVILLSNDINLRNKALINDVTSYGPSNIFDKINRMKINEQNKQKVDQIISILENVCTKIISSEMEEAYGSVLFNLITEPPWDFQQCLVYFKRFWSPVFSLVISQKQCLKVIDDLLIFIQTHNDLSTEENMEDFIKLCLSLCVYFKNCLNKYQKMVKTCIDDLQTILK